MASRYTGIKIWLATAFAGGVILGTAYFATVSAASSQPVASGGAQALGSSSSLFAPAQQSSAPVPLARRTRQS